MAQTTYYTKEGFEKMKQELEHMISVDRPHISAQIAEARDKGDLSENAEYDAAKEAQGLLEMKISKLQYQLRNARLLDESRIDTTTIQVLSTVKLKNMKTQALMTYTLVPESEADLKKGKLSVTSPIAQGLLGKEIGEKVNIAVPAGIINIEVIDIQ